MTNRIPPMQDATLIDAMNRATSLELYQLSALVERLMTDPRRIVAIRKDLHLGQVVRFYDARRDVMRNGRITDMRDAYLMVQGTEHNTTWKLPYVAIEPPALGTSPHPTASPPPAAARPTRADFHRGDQVSFTDRHLQTHIGVITRCNPKTASVDCGGEAWGVPYGALRLVLDIN